MNTHSHEGDCRMELLAAAGIRENVSLECLKKILDCVTTEEALAFIDAEGKKEDVMEDIMEKIDFYLKKRAAGRLQIACIVYSNNYGLLGMTAVSYTHLDVYKRQGQGSIQTQRDPALLQDKDQGAANPIFG